METSELMVRNYNLVVSRRLVDTPADSIEDCPFCVVISLKFFRFLTVSMNFCISSCARDTVYLHDLPLDDPFSTTAFLCSSNTRRRDNFFGVTPIIGVVVLTELPLLPLVVGPTCVSCELPLHFFKLMGVSLLPLPREALRLGNSFPIFINSCLNRVFSTRICVRLSSSSASCVRRVSSWFLYLDFT